MNLPSSDALVFFGATGDLANKKIFPALYAMERRGHLRGLATPVYEYQPGTLGPRGAETLSTGNCGCDSPVWLLPPPGNDGASR